MKNGPGPFLKVPPVVSKRPRVEMVPLIDCFFLLLVFFIFGVFSMTLQQGIWVDLPAAAQAASLKEETVTISVTAEGALFVNDRPVALEALGDALRQAVPPPVVGPEGRSPASGGATGGGTLVVIRADRASRHGLVVSVLDAVRQAGLQHVSFQTEPPA